MKPLTQEFCATIAGNDPTKTKYRQIDDNLYDNFCYDKHHNNIGSIVIQCGLPSEQTLNFDNITDQLISQVQKGNQDAINLLNSINQAIEQEKKASAITTQPKPSVPVVKPAPPQTDADAKPKEESKAEEKEPKEYKTCSKDYSQYPRCAYLNGFKYYSRDSAIAAKLTGLRGEKKENYNDFSGSYGTHEKFFPNKKKGIQTPKGSYGASLSSCECCQDSSKGAYINIKWRAD